MSSMAALFAARVSTNSSCSSFRIPLWWRLVQLRIVELLHTIFGEPDELDGGVVCGQGLDKLLVLLLPNLRGLLHRLVEFLDAVLECLDLALQCGDCLLRVSDGLLKVGDVMLQGLLLVVFRVELRLAPRLLLVVLCLLLRQERY